MRGKNMSNEKIKDSEYYLKDISKSLNNLNKIMSCFLVIATTESIFKKKTNNEIVAIMPQINETLKSIYENIYD
jgi:DNA-directed RNA polymerase subunit F